MQSKYSKHNLFKIIKKSAEILNSKGVDVDIFIDYNRHRRIDCCIVSFKPKDRFRFCYSCTSKSLKQIAEMLDDMATTCKNGEYKVVRNSGMRSALKHNVLWQM